MSNLDVFFTEIRNESVDLPENLADRNDTYARFSIQVGANHENVYEQILRNFIHYRPKLYEIFNVAIDSAKTRPEVYAVPGTLAVLSVETYDNYRTANWKVASDRLDTELREKGFDNLDQWWIDKLLTQY